MVYSCEQSKDGILSVKRAKMVKYLWTEQRRCAFYRKSKDRILSVDIARWNTICGQNKNGILSMNRAKMAYYLQTEQRW